MNHRVRPAQAGDLDSLVEIENACFHCDRISPRQLKHLLLRGKCQFLVAECDGVIAGYVVLLTPPQPRPSRLYSLAVTPQFRGRKLGGILLDSALNLSHEHGYLRCRLEVRSDDRLTQGMYVARGFVPYARLPAYYGDGCDALRMEFCQEEVSVRTG